MEKLSDAIDYFNNLVKTAFLEVPPTVFKETFEIYKEMLMNYMKDLEALVEKKRNSKSKFNKKFIFSDQIDIWRNWIKNLEREDNYFISYIMKKYPKLIKKFVDSDQKEITFLEKIPTINEMPISMDLDRLEFLMTIKKEYLEDELDNGYKHFRVSVNNKSLGTFDYEETSNGLMDLLEGLYYYDCYKKYSEITKNYLTELKTITLSDEELESYKSIDYWFDKNQLLDWKYVNLLHPGKPVQSFYIKLGL